jgi:hypothetical protein
VSVPQAGLRASRIHPTYAAVAYWPSLIRRAVSACCAASAMVRNVIAISSVNTPMADGGSTNRRTASAAFAGA